MPAEPGETVGAGVGAAGVAVGTAVGAEVCVGVGACVGRRLGALVGAWVGETVTVGTGETALPQPVDTARLSEATRRKAERVPDERSIRRPVYLSCRSRQATLVGVSDACGRQPGFSRFFSPPAGQ